MCIQETGGSQGGAERINRIISISACLPMSECIQICGDIQVNISTVVPVQGSYIVSFDSLLHGESDRILHASAAGIDFRGSWCDWRDGVPARQSWF